MTLRIPFFVIGLLTLTACGCALPTRGEVTRKPVPGYDENDRRIGTDDAPRDPVIELHWE